MAIDIQQPDHRSRLAKALRTAFSQQSDARLRRKNLIDIYKDSDKLADLFSYDSQYNDLGTLINHFQKFVRGHMIVCAYQNPKFSVKARTMAGRGLDTQIQTMLQAYLEILNFNTIQKRLALDSAFGWAIAKVTNGPPPKGITAPVAPRVYRINPDHFIVDPSASCFEEAAYSADVYLVPLNEAREYEGFDPELRAELSEYREQSSAPMVSTDYSSEDIFAEPYTRLIDVYIPSQGKIYTWGANTDDFERIASQPSLQERQTPVNPYSIASMLDIPNQLSEIARLSSLRGLHLISNEFLIKGVEQGRASQRNPVAPLGSEQDMTTALGAGDNNPIFLEDPSKLGLYNLPGPDNSILGLSQMASSLFSQEAGNLEVALGQSAGASTARQTQSIMAQISASQSIDRTTFETFLSDIGKKLATLAFHSEVLQVETIQRIPGTTIEFPRRWAPPEFLPRTAAVDDFKFEVTPYSTTPRSPQERVNQLQTASQMLVQWFMAKAQGMPINIQAVMLSLGEAFDMVPELTEWWSGEEPTPQEKTAQIYQSMAPPPQGSEVNYNSNAGGGEEIPQTSPGGLQGFQ